VFFARFVPPIRAFVPITAGALAMPPSRFYPVNIAAILLWAPAHVFPGVLAIHALHQYAGIPRHAGVGKYYWILAVIGGAIIVALATWTIRRRHGTGAMEPEAEKIRKDFR
jgi:membrane-associated protein